MWRSWYSDMLIVMRFFSVPVLFNAGQLGSSFTRQRDGNSQLHGQSLAQLSLSHSSGSEEHEASDRPLARVQSSAREADRLGHGGQSVILTDDSVAQDRFEVHETSPIATEEGGDGNASGLRAEGQRE